MKSILGMIARLTRTFLFQLIASFVAVILLMSVALVVGIFSVNQLLDQSTQLAQYQYTQQSLLQLKIALLEKNFQVSRYVLLNQYQALYDYAQQPNSLDTALENATQRLTNLNTNLTMSDDLQVEEKRLDSLIDQMIMQLQLGNHNEASLILQNEFSNEVKRFNDLVQVQTNSLTQLVMAQEHATHQTSSDSKRWLAVGGFLIGLVALATALVLAVIIGRRVRRLRQAVVELGQGNFQARVIKPGHDELGRVGYAFNQMAAQLDLLVHDLEERNRELEALQDISHRLHGSLNLAETSLAAVTLVMEVVEAQTGHIYLIDEKDPAYMYRLVGLGEYDSKKSGPARISVNTSLLAQAISQKKTLLVQDILEMRQRDPNVTNDPDPRWRSGLFVPLITGGETIGVLSLTAEFANHFSTEQLRFVEAFASQLATVIRQFSLLQSQRETEKLEAVLTMARTAAHELRQPLTVLLAELDLVAEMGLPLDSERLHLMREAITEMNERVSSYQRIVRYETDLSLPHAPLIDRERAVASSEQPATHDEPVHT